MFFSLFLLQTALAECEKSVDNKEFSEALDSFSMGFVSKNMTLLEEKSDIGKTMLPCLSEPISEDLAHRYHLMVGLYHYVKNEQDLANQSLQIAKHIKPDVGIDYFLYPEGHVIHDTYEQLPVAELALLKRAPTRGSFLFDGRDIPYRPKNSPTIFQIIEDQEVLLSAYVYPDDELPAAPEAAVDVPETTTTAATPAEAPADITITNTEEAETKPKKSKQNQRKKSRIMWGASIASFAAMSTTGLIYYRNGLNNPEVRYLDSSPNATALFWSNYFFLTTTVVTATRAALLQLKKKKRQSRQPDKRQ